MALHRHLLDVIESALGIRRWSKSYTFKVTADERFGRRIAR
jgi:hypothetical protein